MRTYPETHDAKRLFGRLAAAGLSLALVASLAPATALATESGSSDSGEADHKTKVTTELVVTAKTSPVSSKKSAIRTVKVYKPKLITTTTDVETGKVLSTTTARFSVKLQVHVPTLGWKTASRDDNLYTYKAPADKYVQAVRITPSDNLKIAMREAGVNFFYRAKSQGFGTLGWAKAGSPAGTSGQSRAMTKLTVTVAKRIPGSSAHAYITAPSVQYKTALSKSSWRATKSDGATSGKQSWKASLGRVAIKVKNADYKGGISYSTRTGKSDKASKWSKWKKNFNTSGGKKARIQAIRIKLTGELASKYNVYYRLYCSDHHWMGWAKNGAKCGTKNINYPAGALQVKILAKGLSAPGSTSKQFSGKQAYSGGGQLSMLRKAQKYSSSTKYLILVNRAACRVAIFTGSQRNWTLKKYWSCCVGKPSTPTISGSHTVGVKFYSFGEEKGYSCYYATQISGDYLFHSVLYYPHTRTIKSGILGAQVSHGCVRLAIGNAKWIQDNVPGGSKIFIY